MDIEVAKKAEKIIKKVIERLTDERDIAQYKDIPAIFNNAAGMLDKDEIKTALLNVWTVSQATNAIFLLWRRQIEHADLEAEWRELPTTDVLAQVYEDLLKEDKKIADKIEAERRAYMDGQQRLDIFKAVLNGQSKEEAERKYKEYQDKLSQSIGA